MRMPSLPPGIGGPHAVALGASAILMTATAGFRVFSGELDLSNILLSACVLGWDLGVSGMVHWSGYKLAASRAAEEQYEAELLTAETARRHTRELTEKGQLLAGELAAYEAEQARRMAFDFETAEVKAWASAYITAAYARAVGIQRGGRFSKD